LDATRGGNAPTFADGTQVTVDFEGETIHIAPELTETELRKRSPTCPSSEQRSTYFSFASATLAHLLDPVLHVEQRRTS